jgi:transcriptional regulator with PAS, ATPase and Fis domain
MSDAKEVVMTTLEEKQKAMRERHAEQSRTGRPRTQSQEPTFDRERMRRRIAAFTLLESGHSVSQVASTLNISIEALTEWRRLGCPLSWYFRGAKHAKQLSDLQRNP